MFQIANSCLLESVSNGRCCVRVFGPPGDLKRDMDFLCGLSKKQSYVTKRVSRHDFQELDCSPEVSFPVLANQTAFRSGSPFKARLAL